MTFSVIIPAYNGLDFLKQSLPVIKKLNVDEIIIVDDASTDGTAEFISQHYPEVKLISHTLNQRFPISVNDGTNIAIGEILILLNQDVIPDPKLLTHLPHHFNDPQVFAVTFNESDRSWAKAEIKNGLLHFENGPADNYPHQSFWPSGGSSAIRKSMWNELHGFDPIFTPGYYEDLDLGWRANKKNWKTIWEPNARVNHAHPESTFNASFTSKALVRIKERNYLLAHWRNLDKSYLPSHFISIFKRLLSSPGYVIPVFQALIRYAQV